MVTNSQTIISGQPVPPDQDDPADTAPEVEMRHWPVADIHHRERLDKVLAANVVGFSRNYLQQLVEQGAVQRNGRVVTKPSLRLQAGDAMEVALRPTPQSTAFTPEAMALEIVYEDDHMMVIHKPAGLVVHPAPGNWSGTLLNGLLAWDPRFGDLPRAGIVHRLDKDTSGLMLVARTRPCMDALVRMIAERSVQRQYLALAHKPWSGPSPRDVQAAIGHPLLGDTTYGAPTDAPIGRQALHAYRLALAHPVDGRALAFGAPLPADMLAALAAWGLRYNPS